MKYSVGQKVRFIGSNYSPTFVGVNPISAWTNGKIYTIHSYTDEYYPHGKQEIEYRIVRDDGQIGLWWEKEMKKKFISLREERKLKLKKIGYERTNH
jgi:hypothetical protein